MSDRHEKYRARYLETVSEKLGEPAEAVGMFTRPGSMGSVVAAQVSPLASFLTLSRGKKKAGGMPLNVIVGVTADKVYVFPYKPKGFSVKLKDPVAAWDRADVRIERLKEGTVANRLRFHLPGGDSIELDSTKMPGSSSDFNAPLIDLLAG
jgi:hypothetical protein